MPTLDETGTSHRLPRIEAVDHSSPMNHSLELGSIESAVDDMLIPPTPMSESLTLISSVEGLSRASERW